MFKRLLAISILGAISFFGINLSSSALVKGESTTCVPLATVSAKNQDGSTPLAFLNSARMIDPEADHGADGFVWRMQPVENGENSTSVICQISAEEAARMLVDPRIVGDSEFLSYSFVDEISGKTQIGEYRFTVEDRMNIKNNRSIQLPTLIFESSPQVQFFPTYKGSIAVDAPWALRSAFEGEPGKWIAGMSVGWGSVHSQSGISISGLTDGMYAIEVNPTESMDRLRIKTQVFFEIKNGSVQYLKSGVANSSKIEIETGNVSWQFTDQDWNQLSQLQLGYLQFELYDQNDYWLSDSITQWENGRISANLADGRYSLKIIPTGDSGFAATHFEINVLNGLASAVSTNAPVFADSLRMQIVKANVLFDAVSAVDGNPIKFANFNLFNASQCGDPDSIHTCSGSSGYGSGSTGESGRFGLFIDPALDTDFWVIMDPEGWGDQGLAKVFARISKSSDGELAVTSDPLSSVRAYKSDQSWIVETKAKSDNLTIKVIDSKNNLVFAHLNSQKKQNCNMGCTSFWWLDSNWVSTNEVTGLATLNLYPHADITKYSLQVNPNQPSLEVAGLELEITANSTGLTTLITAPSYLGSAVVAPTADNPYWTIKLPAPNVFGKISAPDTGEPVGAYLNAQAIVENGSSSSSSHINVDQSGLFQTSLAPGTYKITIEPWDEFTDRYAENRYQVAVDLTGKTCLTDPASFDSVNKLCVKPISPTGFDFKVAIPNLTGTIFKDINANGFVNSTEPLDRNNGEYGRIEIAKWSNQYKYWHVYSSRGLSASSKYALNVTEDGVYQIAAKVDRIKGFGSNYQFVFVYTEAGVKKFCIIPEPGLDTLAEPKCGSNLVKSDSLVMDIPLLKSNLNLDIQFPSSFNGSIYGNVAKLYEVTNGWENWISMDHFWFSEQPTLKNDVTKQLQSSIALRSNNGEPARYRISLNSSSFSGVTNLAPQDKTLWVGRFSAGSAVDEICLNGDYNIVSQKCAEGKILNTLTFVLSTGNLAGQLLKPFPSDVGISYGQIQVDKWKLFGSYGYQWSWVNKYTQSNESGKFALDISEPGFYRITAKQNWGATLPLTDKSYLIEVNSEADWCVINSKFSLFGDINETSPVVESSKCTAEQFGRDNEPGDAALNGLTLRLGEPTVSGTLFNPDGSVAPYSWVNVMEWVNSNSLVGRSYTSTDSTGKFYLNLDDGNYELYLHPNYSMATKAVPGRDEICIGVSDCPQTVEYVYTFKEPNIKGIVCSYSDPSCNASNVKQPSIWALEKLVNNDFYGGYEYKWVNSFLNMSMDGTFAMYLPPSTGSYELRTMSHNPAKDGSEKVHNIKVDDTGCSYLVATTPIPASSAGGTSASPTPFPSSSSTMPSNQASCTSLKLDLQKPNVSGQLTYDQTNLNPAATKKVMPWAWLNVYKVTQEGWWEYVRGTAANVSGEFALNLPDTNESGATEYVIDVNSVPWIASRPQIQLRVFAEGQEATWRYRFSPVASPNIPMPMDADFDNVSPNVLLNLDGIATSRVILVRDVSTSLTREQSRRYVTNGGSPNQMKAVLTNGHTYEFKVVPNFGETLDYGTASTENCKVTYTVDKDPGDLSVTPVSLTCRKTN